MSIPHRLQVAKGYWLSANFISNANSDINITARVILFADIRSVGIKLPVDFTFCSILLILSFANFKI